jgi:hypothetical protein
MSRIDGMIALNDPVRAPAARFGLGARHRRDPPGRGAAQAGDCRGARGRRFDGLEFGVAVLLRNLIDNASRYGPDGGTIRVSTGRTRTAALSWSRTPAQGIAPEQYERVFERFYRLARDSGVDGCGIGLSIVQAVVEAASRQYRAGAQSDLGGLRVTVRFPAARDRHTAPASRSSPAPAPALAGAMCKPFRRWQGKPPGKCADYGGFTPCS